VLRNGSWLITKWLIDARNERDTESDLQMSDVHAHFGCTWIALGQFAGGKKRKLRRGLHMRTPQSYLAFSKYHTASTGRWIFKGTFGLLIRWKFQIQHIFRALNVHMFPGPGIRKLCDSTFLPIIPFHSRAPQCLFNHSRPINSSAAFRAP